MRHNHMKGTLKGITLHHLETREGEGDWRRKIKKRAAASACAEGKEKRRRWWQQPKPPMWTPLQLQRQLPRHLTLFTATGLPPNAVTAPTPVPFSGIRSMAALAVPCKVGRQAELQRSGGAAQLRVISGGAHLRVSEEICFREAALSTNSLCGRGRSWCRDWRVCSSGNANGQVGEDGGRPATRLNATVEKANDVAATQDKNMQMFGSSEASCDEGSSYLAVESILEDEGGKSVEDYKLRAHIFSESDIFFTALKDRNSSRSVQ